MVIFGDKPFISIFNTKYAGYIVSVITLVDKAPDNIVQARTKATASDYGDFGLCRLEENFSRGPAFSKEMGISPSYYNGKFVREESYKILSSSLTNRYIGLSF